MRVGLSTTAIFGNLSGYFFGNFKDEASDIIWRYATLCWPVTDCKTLNVLAVQGPWRTLNGQNAPECVLAVQGPSGSSKVDDFGTNRKHVCDFLLVRHCDYGAVLHRFWDTATYWPKIAYFSYPSLIRHPRSQCSLWNFALKLSLRKLESWGYPPVKPPGWPWAAISCKTRFSH